MCKDCKNKTVLNLRCNNCGSSHIIKTDHYKIVINDLGLSCKESIYICTDCKEEFLICPECNGTGFCLSSPFTNDYNDCAVCYGMGLVKIKNFDN